MFDGELSPKLRDSRRPLSRVLRDIVERNKAARSYKRRVRFEVLPYSFAGMVAVNEEKIDRTTAQS